MNAATQHRRMSFTPPTEIALSELQHCVPVSAMSLRTQAYEKLQESVRRSGLIKPLVVIPPASSTEDEVPRTLLVVDGQLRLSALRANSIRAASCVTPVRDRTFARSERFNMPSLVQEHQIVDRALQAGWSSVQLAKLLGVAPAAVDLRRKMLRGICADAIAMLSETSAPEGAFAHLRRMVPERQIKAAKTMVIMGEYSARLSLALLRATPRSQLIRKLRTPNWTDDERAGALEAQERLSSTAELTSQLQSAHAQSTAEFVILRGYVRRLLANAKLVGWLARERSEDLRQLQSIADTESL